MIENPSYTEKPKRTAEKSQFTEPQEEFIEPEAIPSTASQEKPEDAPASGSDN